MISILPRVGLLETTEMSSFCILRLFRLDTLYVANMLAILDTSKSSGPDDISSMMLKSTAYSIAPSLAKLFNTSLAKGALPTEWKLARVVPVPKSDDLKKLCIWI